MSRTFSVGLLYGPSGSGKSSLHEGRRDSAALAPGSRDLRRGLPRRDRGPYPGRLEPRIPRPAPPEASSAWLTAALRERGAGIGARRSCWFWTSSNNGCRAIAADVDGELVRALRQCDGLGCQALILVRDDFWMATTRFLRALDIRLLEGVNSVPVELFDLQHAGFVLAELGRALGRIKDGPIAPGSEEARFIEQAVKELAGAGRPRDPGALDPVRGDASPPRLEGEDAA